VLALAVRDFLTLGREDLLQDVHLW
jgi:hypothetical protein